MDGSNIPDLPKATQVEMVGDGVSIQLWLSPFFFYYITDLIIQFSSNAFANAQAIPCEGMMSKPNLNNSFLWILS